MNFKIMILIGMYTSILASCTKTSPLLENHLEFVGQWKNENSALKIDKNGQVKYVEHLEIIDQTASQNIKSSATSDIKAPITQFNQQQFQIGQGTLSRQFKIDRAPFKQNGKWRIIINGQLYTKK